MASTSKYISLDPQVLVEYEYTDPSSPNVIETDANGAKILLLKNSYTNTTFLYTEDNPYVNTGNYRYRSAIPIDAKRDRWAYLTTSNVLNYLDADSNLPSVNDLLAQESDLPNVPVKNPAYDTIKIHLVSGFSFEDRGDGFVFEVRIRDRAGRKHNLASIVYRAADNYETNNPVPFISAERLFSKYIELQIPAQSWLTNEYYSNPSDPDSLSNLIADGKGFNVQNTIEISLRYIVKTEQINGQTYYVLGESNETSINKTDEYSGLAAIVQEAVNGDYFEVYGEYNGDVYEDFIISLNNQPDTDLVVVHDLSVIEQVGTGWVKTSEQSFIQTDSFDETYKFRPIILNSHIATSYRIDYALRILNKIDNSQIIRRSQFASFDVKKYGRRFRKLNLGTVPNITKVYNTVPEDTQDIILNNDISFTVDGTRVVKQTEFVMGFKETVKVSASLSNVRTSPSVNQEGDIQATARGSEVQPGDVPLEITTTTPTDKIFPQGEGRMTISPFDDFIKIIFYDNSIQEATGANEPQLMDLTPMGRFYLSFMDEKTGDEIRVPNFTNIKGISPAQGEVVFKITKEESKKILKYSTNNFYISSRLEIGPDKSDETMMYAGQWYRPEDKYEATASEIIKELNGEKTTLKSALTAEKEAGNETIRDLEEKIRDLERENKTLKNTISNNTTLNLNELLAGSSTTDSVKSKDRSAEEKLRTGISKTNKFKRRTGVSQREYENQKGTSIKNTKIDP